MVSVEAKNIYLWYQLHDKKTMDWSVDIIFIYFILFHLSSFFTGEKKKSTLNSSVGR